ncbi:MAG: hypothetical protein AB8B69_01410 [Chitinophagales bacterium]
MKKLFLLLVLMFLPILLISLWMNGMEEEVIPLSEQGKLSLNDPASMKTAYLSELLSYQPEIVLLGNSMLGRGVNHNLLQSIFKRKISKFAIGGTSSRWWYLMTKNVIAKSDPPPKALVLFFRDQFLTNPKYRLNSANQLMNKYFYEGEEPLIQELSYDAASVMYQQIPLYDKKHLVNQKITDGIKNVTRKTARISPKRLTVALDKSFDESKMIEELITAQQLEAAKIRNNNLLDFDNQIDRSFLPHIIELTKDAGIQLILVRTKRRSAVLGKPENPLLTEYIEGLNTYLKQQKVPLMDYTQHEQITLSMYAEGDHLSEEGMNRFTQKIFSKDLEALLKELKLD